MNRERLRLLRKKVLPALVVLLAAALVASSLGVGAQDGRESFAFNVNWPVPSEYSSTNPQPNVFLQINYTGSGVRDFSYTITSGSSVLAQGTVGVTARSPFTVYVFSPFPALLHAQVTEQGKVVYAQSLRLGQ